MYYLVYGFLYLLSLLPMWMLYLISDGFYILIYHIIGYRREVVMNNLSIAFPEKPIEERLRIAKKFYHNFIDNFIETIKLISAGEKFIKKRFIANIPEIEEQYRKGRRCQVHLGHNFNWEMANLGIPLYTDFPFIIVYMPITNKIFERLFVKLRSKTGTILLPATKMKQELMAYRNQQYLLALVADQVPGNMSRAYWLNFFGKPTPFAQGPEKGARAGNIPVVFAKIIKKKRGYYEASIMLATDDPNSLSEGELTRRYRDYLEQAISEHPDMWLWSHRRWKREWKNEYAEKWIDTAGMPSEELK